MGHNSHWMPSWFWSQSAMNSDMVMFLCTRSDHLMYILFLSFISVLAPDWLVSFMHKYFNMGLLDADVSNYFDSLTESLIEERKSSDGSDFLQTLANNLAEAPASDPDTSINHLGKAWTKKGMQMSSYWQLFYSCLAGWLFVGFKY